MKKHLASTWPVLVAVTLLVFGSITSAIADVPKLEPTSTTTSAPPPSFHTTPGNAQVASIPAPGAGNWTWVALAGVGVVAIAVTASALVGGEIAVEVAVTSGAASADATKKVSMLTGVTHLNSAEASQLAHATLD